ncbi:MAG TPA: Ig-like domain repeat protein [Acidobacteriaceae bacterium]|nr:Ig-like domain repeat protein [Acidobacteriaceae bacterium]
MSEKIFTRLFRLYPSSFRKEYEGQALQLIRDRLRDETGFFKRARLWWDLVADVLAGLPTAYRNSYTLTEVASLSLNATGIPSFKTLDDEPLGLGSILVGGTISLIVLAAFAFLLSRPIAYQPLSGSNGRTSPIEAVMQRLNRAPATDSAASSLQDAATSASAQMSEPPAQPSTPGTSTPNMSASSLETEIPNGERNRIVSSQMQNLNEYSVDPRNAPAALDAFSKGDKQRGFVANGQESANGATANVRNSSQDSHTVVQQSPRYSGTIAKLTPTVALSYLPANPAAGSMVNLTATVLAVGTGPAPTGNVRFFDGTAVLNMGKLHNGTLTVKGKIPNIATHSLSAIYDGDANYSSASSIGEKD